MILERISHYQLKKKLGAGGMGEVYLAEDTELDRMVALKILPEEFAKNPDRMRRFIKEAKAASSISHPGVATIYEIGSYKEIHFISMEYVPGETLAARMAKGALEQSEILRICIQIAGALEEAHSKGITHRDIKPGNVMITTRGDAKLLDFGLAKIAQPEEMDLRSDLSTLSKTELGTVLGTLPYMSPEQLRGELVDGRSDLYSFGLVLYEMATGDRPFQHKVPTALSDAILHQPPPLPRTVNPRISPGLENVILKCLEKAPENRYQSAKELAIDLRRLEQPSMIISAPVPVRRVSRMAVLVTAALGIIAVIAVLFGWNIGGLRDRITGKSDRRAIASLVALPSKVLAAHEDAFLADAIPNTISTQLARIQGLETKVPPAGVELERFGGDLGKIAAAYNVNAFVLSTVTAEADQLVLNVQLVQIPGRTLLWSREYEGKRQNYLDLVRQAAEDLRLELRPATDPLLATSAAPVNSDAELAFQRGFYYSNRFNNLHLSQDFEQALQSFQHALTLDSKFADAAAETAWLFDFKAEAGEPLKDVIPQIDTWTRRAIEIDPRNGRAWALLAILEAGKGETSERKLLLSGLRAVKYAPRFPKSHVVLPPGLRSCRLRLEADRQAARLDPLYLYPPALASIDLACLHRTKEALAELNRVLEIEPDMPFALLMKAIVLIGAQRMADATLLLKQLEPMAADGRLNPGWFAIVRDLKVVLQDNTQEGEMALRRLVQVAGGKSPIFHGGAFIAVSGHWLASRGKLNEAGQLLLALDRTGKTIDYDLIRLDPHFQWILRDPKYKGIVERSQTQFKEMLEILDEARTEGQFPEYLEKPLAELRSNLNM